MPDKKCGAKTRSGGKCNSPPVKGRKRCRMHGGSTPQGEDSPHHKHGQFSAAEKKARARRRKAWREAAELARKGDLRAMDIVREEYANAVERHIELDELVDNNRELAFDRAIAVASSERRLAARHLVEVEATVGDQTPRDDRRPVELVFFEAPPPAGPAPGDGDDIQ